MSFSCLLCPVLNAIFGIALLALTSESLQALRPRVEGLFVVVYLLWFLVLAASYASPFFSCLGIVLALLGPVLFEWGERSNGECHEAFCILEDFPRQRPGCRDRR
jgi:hypothetical protein